VLDAGDAAGLLTGIAEWILADLGVQSIRQTTGSPTVRVAERATAHRRHTTTSTRIAG
jgi:hypothetical protein